MLDPIEKLKREYTDKYVEVDASRPELARFNGYTGQIKTVNMNGRALVQFEAWNNIGWYDIDLSFLKVVPKPEPKQEAKKAEPAAKRAPAPKAAANAKEEVIGEKKLSPLEMARQQGAAKKSGDKPKSTADILAAARTKPGEAKAPAEAAKGKLSTAEILAAARAKKGEASEPQAKAAPAAKPAAKSAEPAAPANDPKKMSTAEILAAARAKKSAAEAAEETASQATVATASAKPAEKPAKVTTSAGSPTTTAEKIAWCRQHDSK